MTYRKLLLTTFLVIMLTLLTSGCNPATTPAPSPTQTSVPPTETPVPPTPTLEPTATPIAPTEVPEYSDKVDVGGYKLYIKCMGEGSPTVILEPNLMADRTYWRAVLAENPTDLGVRVCIYDHASQGYSEDIPSTTRTSKDFAEDLHALLGNANISGPYIFVGFSVGATNVRTYRELFPDEVVGLVLIEEFVSLLDYLPPETEDEHPSIAKIRDENLYFEEPKYTPAGWDKKASADFLQAAAPLGDLPLVVLSRDPVNRQASLDFMLRSYGSDTPLDVLNALEDGIAENMTKLAALSSNSTQIFAEEGREIPRNNPERVIEAIRIILEQVQEQ